MIAKKTPVTIIAGFLGAGKTTLINHILSSDHGMRITVLVNDFGAINIDAELIVRRDRNIMELSNGCVCCSRQGDLVVQLEAMFKADPPEYLLIEASGVSQPSQIASVFGYPQLRRFARLDAVVVLVDTSAIDTLPPMSAQLAQSQIEAADIAILTKSDLVEEKEVAGILDRWLLPDLPRLVADHGQIPLELILDTGLYDPHTPPRQPQQHDASFLSFVWTSVKPLDYETFRKTMSTMPVTVFRAKGFLHLADFPDEKIVFQKVGQRMEFVPVGAWEETPETRIVMIGEADSFPSDDVESRLQTMCEPHA